MRLLFGSVSNFGVFYRFEGQDGDPLGSAVLGEDDASAEELCGLGGAEITVIAEVARLKALPPSEIQ